MSRPAPAVRWAVEPDEPRCVCGARVDEQIVRVLGRDGLVPACRRCWRNRHHKRHETVTAAVRACRRDRGHRCRDEEIDIDEADLRRCL